MADRRAPPSPRSQRLPRDPEDRSHQAELQKLEGELERAQIRIREAERRARTAEQELRAHIKGQASSQSGAAEPKRDQAGVSNGDFNLNQVSFEALRARGLSVTQAARLIGERESRGGFKTVDDLDQLRGFPKGLIVSLKRSASL